MQLARTCHIILNALLVLINLILTTRPYRIGINDSPFDRGVNLTAMTQPASAWQSWCWDLAVRLPG